MFLTLLIFIEAGEMECYARSNSLGDPSESTTAITRIRSQKDAEFEPEFDAQVKLGNKWRAISSRTGTVSFSSNSSQAVGWLRYFAQPAQFAQFIVWLCPSQRRRLPTPSSSCADTSSSFNAPAWRSETQSSTRPVEPEQVGYFVLFCFVLFFWKLNFQLELIIFCLSQIASFFYFTGDGPLVSTVDECRIDLVDESGSVFNGASSQQCFFDIQPSVG